MRDGGKAKIDRPQCLKARRLRGCWRDGYGRGDGGGKSDYHINPIGERPVPRYHLAS